MSGQLSPRSIVGRILAVVLAAIVALVASGQEAGLVPGPLVAETVSSDLGAVASNSDEASRAAADMLAAGGNAVDAAVAAAFTLMVAEPGACGLAGNAWLLVHLADGRTVAIDGGSVVPSAFDGQRLKALEDQGRLFGPATVAAPGGLAALALAMQRYGSRPWASILEPAIQLAARGVILSASQHAFLSDYAAKVREDATLAGMLLANGFDPLAFGSQVCNDELARTLRVLQRTGPDGLYRGPIGEALVADVAARGGSLRMGDLARVRVRERQPLRGHFRGFEVVSCPPSAGGAAVIEALNILDALPSERVGDEYWRRWAMLIEAVRVANADTLNGGLPAALAARRAESREWAATRAPLLRQDRALEDREIATQRAPRLPGGTTHMSVVDRWGNAVALTQSLGRSFGSCSATAGLGMIHNDFLEPLAGRAPPLPPEDAPGTVAPTMLLDQGRVRLVLGSAGSERIVSSVVVVVANVVDRGMSLPEAVAAPRVIWGERLGQRRVYVELLTPLGAAVADALGTWGYSDIFRLKFPARPIDLSAFGGVNAVAVDARGRAVAVAEPRRGGVACAP